MPMSVILARKRTLSSIKFEIKYIFMQDVLREVFVAAVHLTLSTAKIEIKSFEWSFVCRIALPLDF